MDVYGSIKIKIMFAKTSLGTDATKLTDFKPSVCLYMLNPSLTFSYLI